MNAARRSAFWFVRVMDSRITTRVVQLVAVLSLMLSFAVAAKQYQLADCLAKYNDQAAKATGQRLHAAEADRQELDKMLRTVVTAKVRGEAAAALRAYVDAREDTDRTRASNPQPAPPSVLCR